MRNIFKKKTEESESNDIASGSFDEQFEYLLSYLAQLNMTQRELLKQITIANALHILDSEYNNADSIMKIDEILSKKERLFSEIFMDYRVNKEQENNNE